LSLALQAKKEGGNVLLVAALWAWQENPSKEDCDFSCILPVHIFPATPLGFYIGCLSE
jgi:hypothetical protein